jgi:chorismate mutase
MEILPLESWVKPIYVKGKRKPVVIAGPCSAETEEQLLATCKAIIESNREDVDILRAGIWKPRTRPNTFEGVGEVGLQWFQQVGKELNIPIATEVATPQHVELALKYGVNVLWIGARSTVNPFTVQDIADVLKGVDIPVIVKNPINPDLTLWLGAIERIAGAGIKKIAAMHRGFSTYEKNKYRNAPMWQIAIELKSKMPNLPIFFDPSHVGGKREFIEPLSQKALDLNYDGLMIETHINPEKAWSDAEQQVTPIRLGEIFNAIRIRSTSSDNQDFVSHLDDLRKRIDRIDHEIVEALSSRMQLVEQIGDYKKANGVAIFQFERWLQVFQTRPEWAAKMGMDKDFVAQLFKIIHDESIRVQTERPAKK